MRRFCGAIVALFVFAGACSDSTGSSVASVTIVPTCVLLQVGESCSLLVQSRDDAGNLVSGPKASWSTGAAQVLTVSATGNAKGITTGAALVTATVSGHAGTVMIDVIRRIDTWRTLAATPTVALGSTDQMRMVLYDAQEQPIPANLTVIWTVENPSVATINEAGVLTPHQVGTVIVSGTFATGGSLFARNASTIVYVVAAP